jgi:hypothetical protein
MTKKELIALLDKYPDDAEIRFEQTGYESHTDKFDISYNPHIRIDYAAPYIEINLDHDT